MAVFSQLSCLENIGFLSSTWCIFDRSLSHSLLILRTCIEDYSWSGPFMEFSVSLVNGLGFVLVANEMKVGVAGWSCGLASCSGTVALCPGGAFGLGHHRSRTWRPTWTGDKMVWHIRGLYGQGSETPPVDFVFRFCVFCGSGCVFLAVAV